MDDFERRPSGLWAPRSFQNKLEAPLRMGGRFICELLRADGEIEEFDTKNLVVNQGLNDILNAYFNAGSQTTSWFTGIFQGNYSPQATDTAATIATSSTECSSYTNATRPAWTPAAPSGQQITNAANRASFTFNASVTVYGAFIVSSNVIAGTAGTLFAAAQFGSSKAVSSGDQLLITYQFNASSS